MTTSSSMMILVPRTESSMSASGEILALSEMISMATLWQTASAVPGNPRRGPRGSIYLEAQDLSLDIVHFGIESFTEMQLVLRPIGHVSDAVAEIQRAPRPARAIDAAAMRQG